MLLYAIIQHMSLNSIPYRSRLEVFISEPPFLPMVLVVDYIIFHHLVIGIEQEIAHGTRNCIFQITHYIHKHTNTEMSNIVNMVYAQSITTESLILLDNSLCKWPCYEMQPCHTINVNDGIYWTYTCNRQTAGNGTLLPQISQRHNHRPLASDQPHSSLSSPVPQRNELVVGADQEIRC